MPRLRTRAAQRRRRRLDRPLRPEVDEASGRQRRVGHRPHRPGARGDGRLAARRGRAAARRAADRRAGERCADRTADRAELPRSSRCWRPAPGGGRGSSSPTSPAPTRRSLGRRARGRLRGALRAAAIVAGGLALGPVHAARPSSGPSTADRRANPTPRRRAPLATSRTASRASPGDAPARRRRGASPARRSVAPLIVPARLARARRQPALTREPVATRAAGSSTRTAARSRADDARSSGTFLTAFPRGRGRRSALASAGRRRAGRPRRARAAGRQRGLGAGGHARLLEDLHPRRLRDQPLPLPAVQPTLARARARLPLPLLDVRRPPRRRGDLRPGRPAAAAAAAAIDAAARWSPPASSRAAVGPVLGEAG